MLKISDILLIFAVYAIINGIVFLCFILDKRAAQKGTRRTPENTLLFYAFIGPFGAGAAMKVFRHKTRTLRFYLVPVFLLLHLGILVWIFLYFMN
jgi:uncharacterized membrane protein YsdA (DUF1294 family)